MRKIAAGKAEKAIDAATTVKGSKPTKSTGPAVAAKATKAASISRAAKPAQRTEAPRISLAALAMGTMATQAVGETQVAKTTRAAKVSKTAPSAKITKTAKVAIAADITDATKVPTNTRRTTKGIRLARNLDVATEATPVLSTAMVQEAPVPTATPENAPPSMPKNTVENRSAAPRIMPTPSLLAIAWSYLRNPPRWVLATWSALAIALAGLVFTQYGGPSDDSSATVAMQTPSMVGPNGEPLRYGPGAYHPVAYRPYAGPGYGGHYDYREGRANGRNGRDSTDW